MDMRPLQTDGGSMVASTVLGMHLAAPRLAELKTQNKVNLGLAVCALVYLAIQIVCFTINQFDNECYDYFQGTLTEATDPEEYANLVKECGPRGEDAAKTAAWGDKAFHMLEFWATFAFNIVGITALFFSPRNLQTVFCSPVLLKMMVFMNICTSLISAMIITINMPLFEVWSHEIEYIDEVMLATVDIIILFSLIRKARGNTTKQKANLATNGVIVFVALCVALAQFCIFNFNGWGEEGFPNGEPAGEKASHDLEFFFGTISAFITFWFCMDNALDADKKTRALYAGDLGKLGLEDMDTEAYEDGDGGDEISGDEYN